jgi:SNF2 family DNA or RNA helicase
MLRSKIPANFDTDDEDSGPTPATVDGSEHFLAITLPSREHSRYSAVLEMLKSHGFVAEPSNGKWWLRDRHKTLNFLAKYGTRLRGEFGANVLPNFEKNTAHLQPAEIACTATAAGKEFDVTLELKAGSAKQTDIHSALMTGRSYVESEGKVILIDAAKLKTLGDAQRALSKDGTASVTTRRTQRIASTRLVEIETLVETIAPGFQPPATWKARSAALRNISALKAAPLPDTLDNIMRSYQRLGAAWLWHLYKNDLGGILSDEMGLGKTLQAIALLVAVNSEAKANKPCVCLVVCPASLLENWRREVERFAPHLKTFVHHGAKRVTDVKALTEFDIVITSYGTLVRDGKTFSEFDFACAIADEAQHIKNRQSQNARALRSISAPSRFVLTGTPVENSLEDLRSLFEFILPGFIDKIPPGVRGPDRAWHDARLRVQTAAYILRRTKGSVAPELPAKLEQVIWCELTPKQKKMYQVVQQKGEKELIDLAAKGAGEGHIRMAALTQLLRLRQICCDPRLIQSEESKPAEGTLAGELAEVTPDSAKLEAFRELISEAIDDGHRILVFSQFTTLLNLLREDLTAHEIESCYLDGSMTPKARQAEVDRFQKTAQVPIFLLSLKAGGTGLNLTGADTVVHYDPWWNPAVEAQATDRAHRIGQTKVVTSYKLIASGTVEEKVLGLQAEKRTLLADVFEASEAAAAKLSIADLRSLLS